MCDDRSQVGKYNGEPSKLFMGNLGNMPSRPIHCLQVLLSGGDGCLALSGAKRLASRQLARSLGQQAAELPRSQRDWARIPDSLVRSDQHRLATPSASSTIRRPAHANPVSF